MHKCKHGYWTTEEKQFKINQVKSIPEVILRKDWLCSWCEDCCFITTQVSHKSQDTTRYQVGAEESSFKKCILWQNLSYLTPLILTAGLLRAHTTGEMAEFSKYQTSGSISMVLNQIHIDLDNGLISFIAKCTKVQNVDLGLNVFKILTVSNLCNCIFA